MATSSRIGGTSVTTALSARWAASLLASLAASQIGGVLMLLFWTGISAVAYGAPAVPLQTIASFAYGNEAFSMLPLSGYLWAALALLGTCALWGMVYSLLATALRVDSSRWAPVALGVAVGLLAHIVGVSLVASRLLVAMYGHDAWAEHIAPVVSWGGYLVFGLGFGAFPPIFRNLWLRFSGRRDLLARDPRLQ